MLVPRRVGAQEPAIPGGVEARLHVDEPGGVGLFVVGETFGELRIT